MPATTQQTTRYVVRCPGCKQRATVAMSSQRPPASEVEALADALKSRGFRYVRAVYADPRRGTRMHCCGFVLAPRPIGGAYVPEVACDDLCRNATGGTCRCSCGGDNHGAGISISAGA
jgi:hypothetical protein